MSAVEIFPGHLHGDLTLPSSKSHTLRAFIFATMADGISVIKNPLISSDSLAMLKACEQLGASYTLQSNQCTIQGTQGILKPPDGVIDCGNSGITFRFLTALCSLLSSYTVITGDFSIRHQRPIEPLLQALRQLGVFAAKAGNNASAPVILQGPIQSAKARVLGSDSQFVSALLILGAFVDEGLEIFVDSPAELPWVDLTCSWLAQMGIAFERQGYTYFKVFPKKILPSFSYCVPGDLSSAAFSIVGALVTNSTITLHNIDLADTQGDKHVIFLLKKMGANFHYDPRLKSLTVYPSCLTGIDIDMDCCIDALPILAVAGLFAKGRTRLYNAEGARHKESNRIFTIAQELKKMGANLEEKDDGLILYPSKLSSAHLTSHQDHRIVMALSIACLSSSSSSMIEDMSAVEKSYPQFFEDMQRIGLKYRLCR